MSNLPVASSITAIAWWTSFFSLTICCVKPVICCLLRLASTAAAWPVRVLLHFDGVGRTSRDIRVRAWVDGLVLLEGGAASERVWDQAFIAGAS